MNIGCGETVHSLASIPLSRAVKWEVGWWSRCCHPTELTEIFQKKCWLHGCCFFVFSLSSRPRGLLICHSWLQQEELSDTVNIYSTTATAEILPISLWSEISTSKKSCTTPLWDVKENHLRLTESLFFKSNSESFNLSDYINRQAQTASSCLRCGESV